MSKATKCLILGLNNYSNRRIVTELKNLGLTPVLINPLKFTLQVSDKKGHDRIYYNGKRIYKSAINSIVPRIGKYFHFGTAVVKHINENMGIYSPSPAYGLRNASDKYKCTQILSASKLQVPKTLYFQSPSNYTFLINQLGGYPVVAKLLTGSQGAGVFILNDDVAGSTALSTITKKYNVLLQEYIETAKKDENKCDVRAWVVGDKVVASMKRFAVDKDFRSNYSISKSAIKFELSEEQKDFAVSCAKSIGLEFCGVDLMIDAETGKTYCIECNGNASLSGIEKVTKINVASYIANHMLLNIASKTKMETFNYSMIDGEEWNIDNEDSKEIIQPFLSPDTENVENSEMSAKTATNGHTWLTSIENSKRTYGDSEKLYLSTGLTARMAKKFNNI